MCTNTLCAIMGGDAILDALQDHLGIHAGETTDAAEGEARVTLEHIECNAACDYAPVLMVNWEFYDNQTPSSARDLVDGLRSGTPPAPTRGAPLRTFRETARTLAGLTDPHSPGGAPGPATLAGLREARNRGMSSSRDSRSDRMTPLTPVLSRFWDEPEPWTLDTYRRHDGYRGLQRALAMGPDDVIALVKDSGLRGRGGAGFPTGTKWSFIPQGDDGAGAKPHYLVVNADESEPGTCKDIPLLLTTPHFLVEGVIIAAYAIRRATRSSTSAVRWCRCCGVCRPLSPKPMRPDIWAPTSWARDSIWS